MYSLVSAPVLGFDLARLAGGAATAELLLAALTLAPGDLPVLATRLPDERLRAELWQEVDAAELRRLPVRALAGLDPAVSLWLVERAPIGSLDGLLHCLRYDVLDWTWQPAPNGTPSDGSDGTGPDGTGPDGAGELAESTVDGRQGRPRDQWPPAALDEHGMPTWSDGTAGADGASGRHRRPDGRQTPDAARASALLCDAVVASYLREELTASARRGLAAGWVGAVRRVPARPADLGPQHRAVAGAIGRIRRSGPEQWARLAEAADRNRNQADWAPAMHSASWAVYLAGRVRAAAAAQLQLVIAVSDAGLPVPELAAGGWNALSGAVHALLVGDLLDLGTGQHLIEPYLTVFGPDSDLA